MCRARTAKQFMIFVVEDDHIALCKQCVVQFSFACRHWCRILARIDAQQGMLVIVLDNSQVAFDRQADDRGRERCVVIIHLLDVAKRRRRKPLRGFVSRKYYAPAPDPYRSPAIRGCSK